MLAAEPSLQFSLPPELEAHEPPEVRGAGRDDVRLLVSHRATHGIFHARFRELPDWLAPGDALVINDSGTLPAELTARDRTGRELPLRVSTRLRSGRWVVEPREAGPVAAGTLWLPQGGIVRLIEPHSGSRRLWVAEFDLPRPLTDYLLDWGRPIRYSYVPAAWPLSAYQTVYSRELGSAEMPSAGRPFTCELVDRLKNKGIVVATLTLHTGVASPEAHEPPYEEWFRVTAEAADTIEAARARGGRVVAVGTTVVRALESASGTSRRVRAAEGWTDLMITPERGTTVVDALLTGLHEPKSTHLAMLEALIDREQLDRAYRAAIQERYLWHEFGDMHLIL